MNKKQEEKKIEKIKKIILADIIVGHGGSLMNYEQAAIDIFYEMEKELSLQKKEIIEEIEKVLEKGHGGGNWRRLIILVLSRLKNNKAK